MHPVETGISVVQRILKKQPLTQILVISDIENDQFVGELLNIGVAYYMIKPFQVLDLIERLKFIHNYYSSMLDLFTSVIVERFSSSCQLLCRVRYSS